MKHMITSGITIDVTFTIIRAGIDYLADHDHGLLVSTCCRVYNNNSLTKHVLIDQSLNS